MAKLFWAKLFKDAKPDLAAWLKSGFTILSLNLPKLYAQRMKAANGSKQKDKIILDKMMKDFRPIILSSIILS